MTGNVFKHIAIAIEKTGRIHKHHLDACRILSGYPLKPGHVEGNESGRGKKPSDYMVTELVTVTLLRK